MVNVEYRIQDREIIVVHGERHIVMHNVMSSFKALKSA